jgi:hypothetical protein
MVVAIAYHIHNLPDIGSYRVLVLIMRPMNLQPTALSEQFFGAIESRCLTKIDRYVLMAALVVNHLTAGERDAIDLLLHRVTKGEIYILD